MLSCSFFCRAKAALVIAAILCSLSASAQEIPPGTALPVTLNIALDAQKATPGQAISATLEQDVPLPSRAKLRAGSRVLGRVVQAGTNPDGSSYLRLIFDQIQTKQGTIAVTTSLRALASPRAVRYAHMPTRTPVRGESEANMTTVQIGEDVVYRGGGPVMHGGEVVGEPASSGGVLAELLPEPRAGCPEGSGHRRLALWVFSSSACGAYDLFDEVKIAHSGTTSPAGEIVIQAKNKLHLDPGTAMLLITTESRQ